MKEERRYWKKIKKWLNDISNSLVTTSLFLRSLMRKRMVRRIQYNWLLLKKEVPWRKRMYMKYFSQSRILHSMTQILSKNDWLLSYNLSIFCCHYFLRRKPYRKKMVDDAVRLFLELILNVHTDTSLHHMYSGWNV